MQSETVTIILKVVFMILFFAVVTIVGTLPIRSKAFKSNPKIRIFGSTFAGALFMNVAILHILPESNDTLEEYLKDGDQEKQVFPLANMIMMVGFLITVFFTKIMTTHEHAHDPEVKHVENISEEDAPTDSLISNEQVRQIKKEEKKETFMREAYVLTVAIYFHTMFQGIAIGVQTQLTQFLAIAVAIGFHKWADALSMGCHYKAKHVPKKTAIGLIIGQAVLNVFAIGLGWIIAETGEVVQAVFLSLSAGTFLAISTMELLSEQLHHRQYIYSKYFLLVSATAFVSSIWFIENAIF